MHLFFDIGGTKTRMAFSENGKDFEDPKTFLTPEDFDEWLYCVERESAGIIKGRKVSYIICGIAGSLNKDKTMMLASPNISGLVNKPIVKKLKKIFHADVKLENDAALAALGEAVYGAGKNGKIVVYLTISTGVGGARVVDKKIDISSFGFEPGHQIINIEEMNCDECDSKGELQDYIGGKNIEKKYGRKPEDIQDDKIWNDISDICAYGVNNAILFWSPDTVVLGGSMMNDPGISIDRVKKCLSESLNIFKDIPEIKKASLEDFGGLYGALALINSEKIK